MAFTPYYPGGWQSGEEGGTPITPDALNHYDDYLETTYTQTETDAAIAQSTDDLRGQLSVSLPSSTVTTWEAIYDILHAIPTSLPINVYFGQTPATIITNNKVSGTILYGTFMRSVSSGNESWTLTLTNAGNSIYTYNIQSVTRTSQTFSTIYRHQGTAI